MNYPVEHFFRVRCRETESRTSFDDRRSWKTDNNRRQTSINALSAECTVEQIRHRS